MAVAAFESTQSYAYPYAPEHAVIPVAALERDVVSRQKAAQLIGMVAMESHMADAPETYGGETYTSLYEAISAAAKGNETAYNLVEANVRTDVIERTLKSGHIISVELGVDAHDRIWQYGQTMESVQANSLRYAANGWQMRQRTIAEARNTFRLQDAYDQGLLNDYYFVVVSRAADNMTQTEMEEAGFFVDTMSTALQLTTMIDGKLVMESAFVAGKATPDSPRHDKTTINTMCAGLGHDIGAMDAAELLDAPMLIHKSLLPNGAVDLVRMHDDAAGGTFFGKATDRQDYLEYRELCRMREESYKPKIKAIVQELLAEAPSITDPVMATNRLGKISGKHMIALAGEDLSIDPMVFGAKSAERIDMARRRFASGNYEQAYQYLQDAVKYDRSSSCPNGSSGSRSDEKGGAAGDTSEDQYGSLEFDCPRCKRINRRPYGKLIPNCHSCGGDVRC